jgi:hypothetical protein
MGPLHESVAPVRRENRARFQSEFLAYNVSAPHQRDHLVKRVRPAHALAAETAVGADNQTLRRDMLQGAPDELFDVSAYGTN